MARGALDAMSEHGGRCAGGIVIAAHHSAGEPLPLPLRVGDHPLPDVGSLAAADAIAGAISELNAGDDILVLLSGGTTSLCAAPCAELVALTGHPADAQQHIADAMDQMMAHGLAIHEMNAIRRRLLRWGAGRLSTALHARGAGAIHVMAISDVIGDDPAVIGSAPCTADPLQPEDVLALCDVHGLRSAFHPTIARALGLAGSAHVAIATAPPSHPAFGRVRYEVIASNADACRAASAESVRRGIPHVAIADEMLQGDAEELGAAIAQVALRFGERLNAAARDETGDEHHGIGSSEGAILIWGGEPTMHTLGRDMGDDEDQPDDDPDDELKFLRPRGREVDSDAPLGGRMQALALSAALALDNAVFSQPVARRITILAAGTDGRDGPTDAAGAIVDAFSPTLIRRAGRDPARDLRRLRSYHALDSAGALVRTGPSGTNVMDIVIAHISVGDS